MPIRSVPPMNIRDRLSMKMVLPLMAIAIFSTYSFAASVSITPSTYQGIQGVSYNVTGGLTAASNGFQVVQATGTATTLPASWTNAGTVQTALTAGHWVYSVTVTLNTVPGATTTYTVSVTWNTGSGYSALGSSLTVSVPTTATAGQTMTFLLDSGLTTFTAPAGIVITVA